MESSEEEMQVFITRLWRERREIRGAAPVLRGTVEHVPSGERRSVKDLSEVMAFMRSYLDISSMDPHGP